MSITENEKVSLKYFEWLGYKNVNGALVKENYEGEVQFYDGNFWYCIDNKAVKKLEIEKDFNNIYLKLKYGKN